MSTTTPATKPARPWNAEHIAALVAQAPPLTDEVWQRISALFASGGHCANHAPNY